MTDLKVDTHSITKVQQSTMWKTRRRITIYASIWFIIQQLLLFFVVSVDKISALKGPIEASNYTIGMIIAAYIGFKSFRK